MNQNWIKLIWSCESQSNQEICIDKYNEAKFESNYNWNQEFINQKHENQN